MMSTQLTNWSDATWWLDNHRVGLEMDYVNDKLEVRMPLLFKKHAEAMKIVLAFKDDLKRFIVETDRIRKERDDAHNFE